MFFWVKDSLQTSHLKGRLGSRYFSIEYEEAGGESVLRPLLSSVDSSSLDSPEMKKKLQLKCRTFDYSNATYYCCLVEIE